MPVGMPYAKGKNNLSKGKMSLSQMMGMEASKDAGMNEMDPAPKKAMMKAGMKQRNVKMRGK